MRDDWWLEQPREQTDANLGPRKERLNRQISVNLYSLPLAWRWQKEGETVYILYLPVIVPAYVDTKWWYPWSAADLCLLTCLPVFVSMRVKIIHVYESLSMRGEKESSTNYVCHSFILTKIRIVENKSNGAKQFPEPTDDDWWIKTIDWLCLR